MSAAPDNSTFREIADVIGEAAAHTLCRHLGGTTLYVPARIGPHHPVAAAIGSVSAQQLADHFRGSHLLLPKAFLRRTRVLELARSTQMTVREIALATDYTERHVYAILEQARRDDRQLDLFAD